MPHSVLHKLNNLFLMLRNRLVAKKKSAGFKSDKQAYDFCRQVYKETNGVTPELREAFKLYQKHADVVPRTTKGGVLQSEPDAYCN